MQLRALPLLWRDASTVQVGTDARWAVALADLSPGATRALVGLPSAATDRALRAAMDAEHVPEAETAAVLAHLRAAHLLVDPPDPARPLHRADARSLSLLTADGDGTRVLAVRSRARVRVTGLDRVGAAIAHGLVLAGVGTVELDDGAPAGAEHVGVAGLTEQDVGRPRAAALAGSLHGARPDVRTLAAAGAPDLVVLVDHAVADPVRHAPLRDADVAHLSVVVREASVLVGPLVLPGRTSCLTCADLHRTDADPAWPALAAQLLALPPAAAESTLATVAAGLACAQVLAVLDGRPTAVQDGALEVALPDLLPRAQQWPPHPSCGCGGHVHRDVR